MATLCVESEVEVTIPFTDQQEASFLGGLSYRTEPKAETITAELSVSSWKVGNPVAAAAVPQPAASPPSLSVGAMLESLLRNGVSLFLVIRQKRLEEVRFSVKDDPPSKSFEFAFRTSPKRQVQVKNLKPLALFKLLRRSVEKGNATTTGGDGKGDAFAVDSLTLALSPTVRLEELTISVAATGKVTYKSASSNADDGASANPSSTNNNNDSSSTNNNNQLFQVSNVATKDIAQVVVALLESTGMAEGNPFIDTFSQFFQTSMLANLTIQDITIKKEIATTSGSSPSSPTGGGGGKWKVLKVEGCLGDVAVLKMEPDLSVTPPKDQLVLSMPVLQSAKSNTTATTESELGSTYSSYKQHWDSFQAAMSGVVQLPPNVKAQLGFTLKDNKTLQFLGLQVQGTLQLGEKFPLEIDGRISPMGEAFIYLGKPVDSSGTRTLNDLFRAFKLDDIHSSFQTLGSSVQINDYRACAAYNKGGLPPVHFAFGVSLGLKGGTLPLQILAAKSGGEALLLRTPLPDGISLVQLFSDSSSMNDFPFDFSFRYLAIARNGLRRQDVFQRVMGAAPDATKALTDGPPPQPPLPSTAVVPTISSSTALGPAELRALQFEEGSFLLSVGGKASLRSSSSFLNSLGLTAALNADLLVRKQQSSTSVELTMELGKMELKSSCLKGGGTLVLKCNPPVFSIALEATLAWYKTDSFKDGDQLCTLKGSFKGESTGTVLGEFELLGDAKTGEFPLSLISGSTDRADFFNRTSLYGIGFAFGYATGSVDVGLRGGVKIQLLGPEETLVLNGSLAVSIVSSAIVPKLIYVEGENLSVANLVRAVTGWSKSAVAALNTLFPVFVKNLAVLVKKVGSAVRFKDIPSFHLMTQPLNRVLEFFMEGKSRPTNQRDLENEFLPSADASTGFWVKLTFFGIDAEAFFAVRGTRFLLDVTVKAGTISILGVKVLKWYGVDVNGQRDDLDVRLLIDLQGTPKPKAYAFLSVTVVLLPQFGSLFTAQAYCLFRAGFLGRNDKVPEFPVMYLLFYFRLGVGTSEKDSVLKLNRVIAKDSNTSLVLPENYELTSSDCATIFQEDFANLWTYGVTDEAKNAPGIICLGYAYFRTDKQSLGLSASLLLKGCQNKTLTANIVDMIRASASAAVERAREAIRKVEKELENSWLPGFLKWMILALLDAVDGVLAIVAKGFDLVASFVSALLDNVFGIKSIRIGGQMGQRVSIYVELRVFGQDIKFGIEVDVNNLLKSLAEKIYDFMLGCISHNNSGTPGLGNYVKPVDPAFPGVSEYGEAPEYIETKGFKMSGAASDANAEAMRKLKADVDRIRREILSKQIDMNSLDYDDPALSNPPPRDKYVPCDLCKRDVKESTFNEHRQSCAEMVNCICGMRILPGQQEKAKHEKLTCTAVNMVCTECSKPIVPDGQPPPQRRMAHKNVCGKAAGQFCPNCRVMVPSEIWPAHKALCELRMPCPDTLCQYRVFSNSNFATDAICGMCDAKLPNYPALLTHWKEGCAKFRIRCPAECGQTILRKDIATHWTTCKSMKVGCSGCEDKSIVLKALPEHLATCPDVSLPCICCSRLVRYASDTAKPAMKADPKKRAPEQTFSIHAMQDHKTPCPCPLCGRVTDTVGDHIKEECEKCLLPCFFCNALVPLYQLLDHGRVCPKASLPCPFQCGNARFSVDALEGHLTMCPNVDQPCCFPGCGARVRVDAEIQHYREKHLDPPARSEEILRDAARSTDTGNELQRMMLMDRKQLVAKRRSLKLLARMSFLAGTMQQVGRRTDNFACPFCSERVPLELADEHLAVDCPVFVVDCLLACGYQGPANTVLEHLRSSCPAAVGCCTWQGPSCSYLRNRKPEVDPTLTTRMSSKEADAYALALTNKGASGLTSMFFSRWQPSDDGAPYAAAGREMVAVARQLCETTVLPLARHEVESHTQECRGGKEFCFICRQWNPREGHDCAKTHPVRCNLPTGCGKPFYSLNELVNHWLGSGNCFLVSCPWGCGKSLPLYTLDEHRFHECSRYKVTCARCHEKVLAKDAREHILKQCSASRAMVEVACGSCNTAVKLDDIVKGSHYGASCVVKFPKNTVCPLNLTPPPPTAPLLPAAAAANEAKCEGEFSFGGPSTAFESHLMGNNSTDLPCPFATAKCSNAGCGKVFVMKNRYHHLLHECDKQLNPCRLAELCTSKDRSTCCKIGLQQPEYQRHRQNHYPKPPMTKEDILETYPDSLCPCAPVVCKKCLGMVPRHDMDVHKTSICPNAEKKCPNEVNGCPAKVPVREEDAKPHLESCPFRAVECHDMRDRNPHEYYPGDHEMRRIHRPDFMDGGKHKDDWSYVFLASWEWDCCGDKRDSCQFQSCKYCRQFRYDGECTNGNAPESCAMCSAKKNDPSLPNKCPKKFGCRFCARTTDNPNKKEEQGNCDKRDVTQCFKLTCDKKSVLTLKDAKGLKATCTVKTFSELTAYQVQQKAYSELPPGSVVTN